MKLLYAHFFALASPLMAAVSQLIIKWQVNLAGPMPESLPEKFSYILELLLRPWVIIAMATTFFSGIAWILAMTRLDLSYAYPYVALPFILVPATAAWLFQESLNGAQAVGILLIISGIIIALSKG